jgi:hypothetical protein
MTNLIDDSQKQKRLEMIRQALKDKAPLMYEELESSGQLQIFLEAHDAEMMASYEASDNPNLEEMMADYLSFSDASYNESTSPMG